MAESDVTLEYLCDNVWIVGSPETVAHKIDDLYAAVGGFGTLLIGATDWPDAADLAPLDGPVRERSRAARQNRPAP